MNKESLNKNELSSIQNELRIRLVQLERKYEKSDGIIKHNIEIYIEALENLEDKIKKMEKSI